MMAAIAGDEFYFDTISRTGERVDSGVLERQSREFAATGESVPLVRAVAPLPQFQRGERE